ncbi:MAG: galactose-1-phosphate uridylyltransferase [Candidatus Bathyarchaeum sp.]|nr:MAG: galactose-1-phosphate uridylyltransferase [Candidatus Bathyarchaeum sp.]
MATNQVRKDYLLNRWVVIAKERKKRPTDFHTKKLAETSGVCPLCLGNEHMTPPAVLVYLSSDEALKKEIDQNGFCHKNWLVRVIPNLYPVFAAPTKKDELIKQSPNLARAVGHHEVIIESSCHNEHLGVAKISQIVYTINAYLDRLAALSKKSYVKHVSIFRNHGHNAGASLSHPHSQLITTPCIPTTLEEELNASKSYWNKNRECLFCDVLKKESVGSRFIWANNSFVVFAPWASVNPFEFWVVPKRHCSNMLGMSGGEVKDLAETMRVCLGGLRSLLNDPPYNFGFHTILTEDAQDCYHWHLEVYPKLVTWAGFEKSTGMFINTISPEDAAAELRSAVQAEKKSLK